MGSVAFLIAFLALPIASFLLVRSVTWVVLGLTASFAIVGTFVSFLIDRTFQWDHGKLQWATFVAFAAVFVAALISHKRARLAYAVGFRRQFSAVLAPALAGILFLLVSRALAAPTSGWFTGVGFLVQREHAEDNAKWLDFTSQLVAGHPMAQGVPLGGPLELFMVVVTTLLSVISLVSFGGVNQVFVVANGVIYAEYLLAFLAPFAFAPLAEAKFRRLAGSPTKDFLPAPLLWIASFVLIVGSLAVSGLGHMTLQFVFLCVANWSSTFLAGTRIPHAYLLSSIGIVSAAIVWFPLTVVAIVLFALIGIGLVIVLIQRRSFTSRFGVSVALWAITVIVSWTTLTNALKYMVDIPASTTAMSGSAGGGGVATSVGAMLVRNLQLLTSQGGTEIVQPLLGVLALGSAVLAALFLSHRKNASRRSLLRATFPIAFMAIYSLVLMVLGTWYAGSGPAYGALKTAFLTTIVVLAVTLPFALMEIDRKRAGITLVRLAAIVGILYLLSIDTLLPRAITYLSPQQWPTSTGSDKGYWWPAEVRAVADQPLAANPIGCAYLHQGQPPSALPGGQLAYSCTRLLVGLAGKDTQAQALVDWERREWLNNTEAWYDEYPNLINMPEDVRARQLILMNDLNGVTGLDNIQSFLDRFKPEWAK